MTDFDKEWDRDWLWVNGRYCPRLGFSDVNPHCDMAPLDQVLWDTWSDDMKRETIQIGEPWSVLCRRLDREAWVRDNQPNPYSDL